MKRKALFIGVNEYEDAQIRNLSYSLSDAHSLKAMFELFGYETDILENPDKNVVLRTVKEMTSDLSAGDFFLFCFAGHGWTTAGGKHLLFCKDDMYEDLRYDYNVGIPFDVLKRRTESGGFDRAFVLDACRTDFITGARGGDETTRDLRPIGEFVRNAPVKSSLAVLRSCSKYEHALEIDSRKHGLFTLALLDVLRQARDSGQELLFGESLCDAVADKMSSIARDEGMAVTQTPEFAKSGAPQVLVCGRKASSSGAATPSVTCPVCGTHNHPNDTFKCVVCGKDYLCLKHYSSETNSCMNCMDVVREKRRREAEEMYEKGMDFYEGRNDEELDDGEATKWFRKAAERGNADAQYKLGECYYLGYGVTMAYAEAVKWYQKAAEQGHAKAQKELGDCYYYGYGVPEDYAEAVKWYHKAAVQGLADAQYELGMCNLLGNGVPEENYVTAVKWYQKAAKQEYADAQFWLGCCYEKGFGVPEDLAEAAKWYRKSAEHGNAGAQYNLGICYEKGRGVKLDYAEAAKWYRMAADQGHTEAKESLDRLLRSASGKSQGNAGAARRQGKPSNNGNRVQERVMSGSCSGDVVVESGTVLKIMGSCSGNAWIERDATLICNGSCSGNVRIDRGGKFVCHGSMSGDIVNHGGDVWLSSSFSGNRIDH